MKSEESLKSKARWLKCNSVVCYFTAAVCAVGIVVGAKEYIEDVQEMSSLNNKTYSSKEVLDRLDNNFETQLVVPIAGSGLGLLTGIFFTLGRRKREDANRIDEYLKSSKSVTAPIADSSVS